MTYAHHMTTSILTQSPHIMVLPIPTSLQRLRFAHFASLHALDFVSSASLRSLRSVHPMAFPNVYHSSRQVYIAGPLPFVIAS
jgi:hypothetical protein